MRPSLKSQDCACVSFAGHNRPLCSAALCVYGCACVRAIPSSLRPCSLACALPCLLPCAVDCCLVRESGRIASDWGRGQGRNRRTGRFWGNSIRLIVSELACWIENNLKMSLLLPKWGLGWRKLEHPIERKNHHEERH